MFRQFVVKIASRCDLACDHCYVYEHADQSWRGRPRFMSARVAEAVIERIAEHAETHVLRSVRVILHGGEPLLAGVERIRGFARRLRSAMPPESTADLRVQTNGLRLDEEFCRMFLEEGIGVGVSIDGDRASNDRHRRYADGRSSYPALEAAIRLLGSEHYRPIFKGLLCTIDVENDPVAVFDALAAFDPPRIDLLLPHATWVHPPPAAGRGQTSYAQWLLAVHRRWSERGRPMDVRLFSSVADLRAGRASGTEALGSGAADVVVVETDGEIEQADSLKTAFPGAPATGFDVMRHSFEEAASHQGFAARRSGSAALSPICRRCPVVRVCGGGLYAHRYDGTGFANPSVYCSDLYTFITRLSSDDPSAPAGGTARSARRGTEVGSVADRYWMSVADFDALARGQATDSALGVLRAAQTTLARQRLARLSRSPASDSLWSVVVGFDAADRTAVNRILTDPFLTPVNPRAAGPSAGVLARIALSCAVLSGKPLSVDLVAHDWVLALPAVGIVPVPRGQISVAVDARSTVAVNGVPVTPFRHDMRLGLMTVRIEDADPARDRFGGHEVAGRLAAAELDAWQQTLDGAAKVLEARHPQALGELAALLTVLVPLRPEPGQWRSATARNAFGAVAVALPDHGDGDDPGEVLASLLLHEIQHAKLGAVLDMFTLYNGSENADYAVGWRKDLRSLEAAMQGIYAHMAVVEYWRARARSAASIEQRKYADRAAELSRQVMEALSAIKADPSLEPPGRRWISGMTAATRRWR